MKKIKRITAVLLSACVVAGGAALTACSIGDGNSDISTDEGDLSNVKIKDKETWDEAFNDIKWSNLSFRIIYGSVCFYGEKSETAAHGVEPDESNLGNDEWYFVKKENSNSEMYFKSSGEKNFTKTIVDSSEFSYYTEIRLQCPKVSYISHFNSFTFDKITQSYLCEDEIELNIELIGPNVIEEKACILKNNVVKTLNGQIVFIKCDFSYKSVPEMSIRYELYNIGTTVVTVPQVVIDNAVSEGRNNQEID